MKALDASGSEIPWMLPIAATVSAVGMWTWLVRGRGWGLREMGFTRPTRSLWHLVWETPLVIIASAVVAATAGPWLGISPTSTSSSLEGADAGPLLALALLTTAVVIPLVEEVCFRRLLLGWLMARTPVWVAVILSGVLFGLLHVMPAVICYVLPLGILLAVMRLWHGSLWASVIVHAANNLLVAAVVLTAL